MKKILSLAAIALAVSSLFLSCASNGAAKSDSAAAPAMPHPRSYEVDPIDSLNSLELTYNQYGPNYQAFVPDLWKLLKADKPQAGDTVTIKMKVTSNIDLPALTYFLIDNSPAANYWTNISEDKVILDMKAGVPVEVTETFTLTTSTLGGFQIIFAYDGKDHGQDAYAKVGKSAKLSFERLGKTTDTAAEVANATGVDPNAPKGPQTYNINLADIQKLIEMKQQNDGQIVTQYQNWIDLAAWFVDGLPQVGDTVTVTFKGTSDRDIPEEIYAHMYESSASVNWWSEIAGGVDLVAGGPVTANEPFTLTASFKITIAPVESMGITFYYKAGDDIKSSTWMYSRD